MRHTQQRHLLGLALLFALLLGATTGARLVTAQGGEFVLPPGVTWDDVNRIASKMYCDVCEGIPLDECESVACRQWREEIARQLGEGRSEDEIVDYFVERYGADVASIPRDRTDRAIAFGVPIAIALLLALVGIGQVRRLQQRSQQGGAVARRSAARLQARPVPDDIDPALLERLQRELEELDG
jgi:cytochrome c-type biogenesis protein CcmH